MSQWGKPKTVDGAGFVPLINTRAFVQETPESLIEDVFMIDDGGNHKEAAEMLEALKQKHIGHPYSLWC